MTDEEFKEICNYLSMPERNTKIEVELPLKDQQRFESKCSTLTDNYPIPMETTVAPYYVWDDGANKWGIELRLYLCSDENIPTQLNELCVNNNRHGYKQFDKRINYNEIIFSLFGSGFILGNQDLSRFDE